MTKADLVERVTAQISQTAGPMISKKDCARVVDSFLGVDRGGAGPEKHRSSRIRHVRVRRRRSGWRAIPRTKPPVEVSARPHVFKPSKELRAMVAGIDISELEDDVEEMTEA